MALHIEDYLVFETPPLDGPIEILGAAIVTLEVASDRPIANLAVRLCDVQPSGESLRVSYGVLNLTHRDGHEKPALTLPGARPAKRCRPGIPSRSQVEARDINGILTNDLAESRHCDAHHFCWHARSAAAAATGCRRKSAAGCRAGIGAA
jgi:hypothetical protein